LSWGFLTVHYYALCILVGIILALIIGRRRYAQLGGNSDEILDVAIYAIPAGILGGRLYHVITSPDAYFGAGGHPLDALKIWQGGMGIWGAISVGALVAFVAFKQKVRSTTFSTLADAIAPTLLFAQAIGRVGNYFNGELFGKPSSLPWALSVPLAQRPAGYERFTTFEPTFLYEALWCECAGIVLIYLGRYFLAHPGVSFFAYVSLYTLGRTWIETQRIDTAHRLFGVRINVWVSALLFVWSTTMVVRRMAGNRDAGRGKG
jgi:prolipoprotein diacylglyceryl transferase